MQVIAPWESLASAGLSVPSAVPDLVLEGFHRRTTTDPDGTLACRHAGRRRPGVLGRRAVPR
jgi:hypothetical protein